MIISVASGKGGTGKTTVAINLALSLGKVQFLDCDVEEPNAHIFLKPKIEKSQAVSVLIPKVDESKCTYCGKCAEVCAYNAVVVAKTKKKVLIFPELCHSCGGCILLCPEKAITEKKRGIGVIEFGQANDIQFIHGRLNIGEAMSPPLIRTVKEHAKSDQTVIIDIPPGTSCPVIEGIKGSDYCILVTEPTPFGLYDLTLAVDMLKEMKVPYGVILNRSDIGDRQVEDFCNKENIPVLMRIPFDREIAVAYSKGESLIKVKPEYIQMFKSLFNNLKEGLR